MPPHSTVVIRQVWVAGPCLILVWRRFMDPVDEPEHKHYCSESHHEYLETHTPPPGWDLHLRYPSQQRGRHKKTALISRKKPKAGKALYTLSVLRQAGRLMKTRTFAPRDRSRFALSGPTSQVLRRYIYHIIGPAARLKPASDAGYIRSSKIRLTGNPRYGALEAADRDWPVTPFFSVYRF